jgi:hypothetical protein
MGSVIPFDPHHEEVPQLTDAGKWKSFAIAYIDKDDVEHCVVFAESVCVGKKLLRKALIQLEKTRRTKP